MSVKAVQPSITPRQNLTAEKKQKSNNVSFTGITSAIGSVMQGIENGGFLASFLIQDTLGMTVPRTYQGLERDKDKLGHPNYKEGMEVGLREGLTGPLMVLTPVIAFLMFKRYSGKATFFNTNLIKRFENTFSNTLKKSTEQIADTKLFKKEFYTNSITNVFNKTVKGETNPEKVNELVNKVIKIDELEESLKGIKFTDFNGKKAVKKEINGLKSQINDFFNNVVKSQDSDFSMVNKVKFEDGTFNTTSFVDTMRAYSHDAAKKVYKNGTPEIQDAEKIAKEFNNTSIAKRFLANLTAFFGTLGVMHYIPKIYAFNEISPGAEAHMKSKKHANNKDNKENQKANGKDVTFEGNALNKLGAKLKKMPAGYFNHCEFEGVNFSPVLMTVISLGGLLGPRVLQANKRAVIKEDGKKDRSEMYEILVRDPLSALTVIFGVPILSKTAIRAAEKPTGFVLTTKPATEPKGFKQFLSWVNPFSKMQVINGKNILETYGNINNTAQLNNFCKFISKDKNGNLYKVLSKAPTAQEVFQKAGLDLQSLKTATRESANKSIIDAVKNLTDDMVKSLMKDNKIAKQAKAYTSIPGAISTFLLVPIVLGSVIPKLTYKNTDKMFASGNNDSKPENTAKADPDTTAAAKYMSSKPSMAGFLNK